MVALLLALQIAIGADEAPLPDWLSEEQTTAVTAMMERDLLYELTGAMFHERLAKGKDKEVYRKQQAALLSGETTPGMVNLKLQPPAGMSWLQSTDALHFEPLTIVDEETLLVQTTIPQRFGKKRVERIWMVGVGTAQLTSDSEAVGIDSLCVELPRKEYTTALGTKDKVRQVRVISDEFIGQVWQRHFKTITPEALATIKETAAKEARKQARNSR